MARTPFPQNWHSQRQRERISEPKKLSDQQRVVAYMGEAGEGSVYGVVASWLTTPSSLFIIVNLVIGTIAVTSRFAAPRKRQLDSPTQLARSPSLLDRVTSFGLGYYKHEPAATPVETEPAQNHDSPRLDRAPSSSLLDRVKSFNLGLHKTGNPHPDDPTREPLTRAPSLLERLMSVKFHRSESEKKPGSEPEPGPGVEILGGGDLGEKEGVDAKADDFIKRFKQQLRLERLDSIIRYRDMLQRS